MIAITPMATSVLAAFCDFGGRKALTPFEIASTPVSAAAPEAKARSTTRTPTVPDAGRERVGRGAQRGSCRRAHLPTPVATRTYMTATNA